MKLNNFDYASYERGSKDGRKFGLAIGIVIGLAIMIVMLSLLYFK
ncbi:hypothetical protein DSM03_1011106 [Leeuwenhoekiella aestuarii]|uniref:Uncharacterized protein n=2 Tax=Leeuwenhoekiella TaxID=283735 RepID=A0A4Q0NZL4_9FLAO|nr:MULTISPECIES: hypothetical protein [Leeuwenhoekiella]RXG18420.1 hypothetical protein DSM04_101617 [Leeuwenhoekiella aestuarii]RXG19725.1 hypothetical protein DSM03_1011106 [Leeuwenhoekiella aestuarii]RXG25855.1 hypothetical protein DSM02_1025 [Leeuwenhoekiella polynyae]